MAATFFHPKNCNFLMNKTYRDCQFPFDNDIAFLCYNERWLSRKSALKTNPKIYMYRRKTIDIYMQFNKMEHNQCVHSSRPPFHIAQVRWLTCFLLISIIPLLENWLRKGTILLFFFSENLAQNLPAFLWETKI